MNHGRNSRTLMHALLLAAGIGVSGCTSAGHRNLTDAIVVTTGPSLAEGETKLVLELRNDREELALSEVDAFLASDRAAKLNRSNRSGLLERSRALRLTLSQARPELNDGLAITRPDPARPFADDNLVIYIAGKSAIHVLFSRAEIGQLLALRECAADLATIRYTHPGFDPARLVALRDRVVTSDLKVANVSPSKSELEQLQTEAATRVLEQYLRENNLPLPDDAPLLTSGPWSAPRSPKLTKALGDPSVVERVLHDHNPNTLRALVFLVNRNVIKLDYP